MTNETNNHNVTTPNKGSNKAVATIDNIKIKMYAKDNMAKLTNYFNGNKTEVMRFQSAAFDYIRAVPKLLDTSPDSLLSALIKVAQFKFLPSSVSGEAYIIPYGTEAKFQLGYQGIITLLYRTGKISAITGNIVYENDVFEYEEGLNAILRHVPTKFGQDKGKAIGCYTIAKFSDGTQTFKVMDEKSIMTIKALSKAKNSPDSPWNSSKDPFNWMWLKTCLIQHSKFLPKTPELVQAIEADMDGEGMEKPLLDPTGPATNKINHKAPETPKDDIRDAEFTEPSEEEKAEILRQENEESN